MCKDYELIYQHYFYFYEVLFIEIIYHDLLNLLEFSLEIYFRVDPVYEGSSHQMSDSGK